MQFLSDTAVDLYSWKPLWKKKAHLKSISNYHRKENMFTCIWYIDKMEIGLVSLYLLIFLTYLINWSRRSASLVLISKRGYQFLFWLRLINLQWSLINRSMFRLTKISRLAYFTVWYPRAFKSIQKWYYLVSGVYNVFYKVNPKYDK